MIKSIIVDYFYVDRLIGISLQNYILICASVTLGSDLIFVQASGAL